MTIKFVSFDKFTINRCIFENYTHGAGLGILLETYLLVD